MNKSKFKCLFGFHNYKKIDQIIGEYVQYLTWDTRGDCGTIVYDLFFHECQCCGKRKLIVNGDEYKKHRGIMRIKNNWERRWVD